MGEHWDLSRCVLYEIRGDATIQDSNLRLPALRACIRNRYPPSLRSAQRAFGPRVTGSSQPTVGKRKTPTFVGVFWWTIQDSNL